MARPERHDVDYFPFIVKRGRTLNTLQSEYGNEGIGFFTNLMRFLCVTPDHHYCIQKESDKRNFFTETGTASDKDKAIAMIKLMVDTEKLDRELWENYQVIVCPALIESLKDAYRKRLNEIIKFEEIQKLYISNEVNGGSYPQKDVVSTAGNTQTKLKETKLNKTKEEVPEESDKSKRFIKPTLEEVRQYIQEKKYSIDAESFIAFYESKGWKIGKSPMKNWRAACVTWERRNQQSKPQSQNVANKKSLSGLPSIFNKES